MPRRVVKTSISLDRDLVAPAKEKSRKFDRFGEPNLSAYINSLIRKDLGLAAMDDAAQEPAQTKRKAAS